MMRAPSPSPTIEDLRVFLTLGVSLLAATRDQRMRPAVVRCGGARLGADGRVRVAIALPEGERTLANIDDNGLIALTGARPTTYRTLQVKGRDARRADWAEHPKIVVAHRRAFIDEVVQVGLDGVAAAALWSSRFLAIEFTPEEIFDQTPGPTAGQPLAL